MGEFFMSNATAKVKGIFKLLQIPLTLTEIKKNSEDLKSSQISMALCYFIRQRYMTREQVPNTLSNGRKKIWRYTFHDIKLPPPTKQEQPSD